jgi:hypothetical protein
MHIGPKCASAPAEGLRDILVPAVLRGLDQPVIEVFCRRFVVFENLRLPPTGVCQPISMRAPVLNR